MFHLFSSTFWIEIHQAQWRPTRLPRRSPVGLWSHKIGIVRCEKIWYFLGPGVGFANDLRFFKKRRRIPQKKIWQKGDSLLWHRKLLDLLVCFHLSKWKRRLNNSIVNVDFCFHLSSTVMSCHHAAPLVRKKPHATCLVGFLQEADEVTQEQQSRGGSRTRETMGETLGTSVSIKGDVWYVSWVWPFCQDAIVAK